MSKGTTRNTRLSDKKSLDQVTEVSSPPPSLSENMKEDPGILAVFRNLFEESLKNNLTQEITNSLKSFVDRLDKVERDNLEISSIQTKIDTRVLKIEERNIQIIKKTRESWKGQS